VTVAHPGDPRLVIPRGVRRSLSTRPDFTVSGAPARCRPAANSAPVASLFRDDGWGPPKKTVLGENKDVVNEG